MVITCCRNTSSETLILFFEMRMLRLLTAIPKPCSRRWVTFSDPFTDLAGLKSLRPEFWDSRLLLKPIVVVVPVKKLFDTP